MSLSILPIFSSKSFIVSGLTFRSLFHFEFIFVYGVRRCSNFTLAVILLFNFVCQALKGPPCVGSYSVVQCITHLMGQPLYCSAAHAGVWGERGYGDCSTRYAWLSNIAFLLWLPVFPPQAFPTTTYWRGCLCHIPYSCLLCQKLVTHRYVGLSLGSLSFPLVSISVFVPVPYCLDDCSLVI